MQRGAVAERTWAALRNTLDVRHWPGRRTGRDRVDADLTGLGWRSCGRWRGEAHAITDPVTLELLGRLTA
jgi:hypothetical protein